MSVRGIHVHQAEVRALPVQQDTALAEHRIEDIICDVERRVLRRNPGVGAVRSRRVVVVDARVQVRRQVATTVIRIEIGEVVDLRSRSVLVAAFGPVDLLQADAADQAAYQLGVLAARG